MRPLALVLLFALASCEKAPPEPALPSEPLLDRRPTKVVKAAEPREKSPPKRCVKPLPKEPPPMPERPAAGACPRDPERAPPMVPMGRVEFLEAEEAPTIQVELMLNDAHRARGLMYRQSLADDSGMLFAWRDADYRSFWMRDTCIPLDMLFIDGDGFIAGIVENVPPLNDRGRGIDCPVNYVLEVNAGFSRKYGILPGQKLKIEGMPW